MNLIEQETWVQAKVPFKDQELTNRINSLVQHEGSAPERMEEETKETQQPDASEPAPSDFLISTGSSDDETSSGRKYKIVKSCIDF